MLIRLFAGGGGGGGGGGGDGWSVKNDYLKKFIFNTNWMSIHRRK